MITQQFVSLSAQRTHELIIERFYPNRHQELLEEKESAKLAAEKEARIQALIDEYKTKKDQATLKPSQQIDTTNNPAKKLDHKDSIKNMFKNKKAR